MFFISKNIRQCCFIKIQSQLSSPSSLLAGSVHNFFYIQKRRLEMFQEPQPWPEEFWKGNMFSKVGGPLWIGSPFLQLLSLGNDREHIHPHILTCKDSQQDLCCSGPGSCCCQVLSLLAKEKSLTMFLVRWLCQMPVFKMQPKTNKLRGMIFLRVFFVFL